MPEHGAQQDLRIARLRAVTGHNLNDVSMKLEISLPKALQAGLGMSDVDMCLALLRPAHVARQQACS